MANTEALAGGTSSANSQSAAQRLMSEARQITEARRSVAAEGVIPIADIRRWADSLDTRHEIALPSPKAP